MSRVVLVCGPQWIPASYYDKHYRARIAQLVKDDAIFVLGAANGVDTMAQQQLHELGHTSVVVYNKGDKDGRLDSNFELINGFRSYPERDAAMRAVAKTIVCTLPQMSGGVGGSMVSVLAQNEWARGHEQSILDTIRAHSEPFDAKLTESVARVYANN